MVVVEDHKGNVGKNDAVDNGKALQLAGTCSIATLFDS